MEETNSKQTKSYNSYRITKVILYFIKFSFLAIIAGALIYVALQDEYFDFFTLNIGTIICLYYFVGTYRYFIITKVAINFENTGFTISYLIKYFNRSIDYNSIQSYTEIKKRNLYRETETSIFLKLKKGKLIFFDYEREYDDFISKLNENNIHLDKNYISPFKLVDYCILIYAVITILTSIYGFHNQDFNLPNSQNDIISISTMVDTIKKNTYHHDYSSITIKLKDYPTFEFKIYKYDLDEKKADELIADKQQIDTFFIEINKKEYDIKLARNIEAEFFQKHWSWNLIKIYGIKTSGKIYFTKFQKGN